MIPRPTLLFLDCGVDLCSPDQYRQVRSTIKEDLGAFPEDLFAYVEKVPIASASLAQVNTFAASMHVQLCNGEPRPLLPFRPSHKCRRNSVLRRLC